MGFTVPTTEPEIIFAGDFITWKKSLSEYPASTWTLTYALVKDGKIIEITASADGDDHLVEEAATTSDDWAPGDYHWQARVSSGTDIHTIDSGKLTIKPNFPAQDIGYDSRTHDEIMLDKVRAVMEGRADKDVLSYSVAGRSLAHHSWAELIELESHYAARVTRADIKAGRIKNTIGVHFNPTS